MPLARLEREQRARYSMDDFRPRFDACFPSTIVSQGAFADLMVA
jgi:hypothetical protein